MGGATQLVGAWLGGLSDMGQANYQKGLAEQNQKLAEQAASDANLRGAAEAGKIATKGTLIEGKQRTGYAASGVDVGSGSALDTPVQTKLMASLDADTVKNNAAREAWGYKVQAANFGAEANMQKRKAEMIPYTSLLSGGSALASSVSKSAGQAGQTSMMMGG